MRDIAAAIPAFAPTVPVAQTRTARMLPLPRPCADFLSRHPWLAFLLMGAAFIAFGFTSVNLYVLLAANIRLFIDYGFMVIEDGALRQLAEIIGLLLLSVLFYLLFAGCERILVRRITERALRDRPD